MKWLLKWLLRLVLVVVVLVVLALVFKDSVLRVVAENRIRAETGMEAKIGRFSSGIFSPVVTLENFKLYNTAEFGGTPFLDIPEIHVEFDPAALAARRLRLTLVRFNLAELDIVKNEAGQTNLFGITSKVKGAKAGESSAQKMLGDIQFTGIDVLNLSFGKVKFMDLKDPRNNREIKVNMQNQVFKNVKSDADLLGIGVMLYLRSGGNLSLGAADLGIAPPGGKPVPAEPDARLAIEKPAAPPVRK